MIFLNVTVFICLQIVVVAMTMTHVGAYEIKRDLFFNADDTFRHKSRLQNFLLDQPFIDKTIGLQFSAAIPVKNQTVGQRTLRDLLNDRTVYPSGFPIFRHQPIKQNSFTITSFRDKPLSKDSILKNRVLQGERAVLRDNPFEGQSLIPEGIFEGQTTTYGSQVPFKEQLFTTETLKNLFRGQSSSAEQASFQKQAIFHGSPSVSNSIKFYRDDYIKPIDLYERYKDILPSFDEKSLTYTKYDSQAPRLSSMPIVQSSEYLLPFNAEMPTTSSSMPVIVHGRDPAISSVFSGMGEAHSSEASTKELGPITSARNCNVPVDSSPTTVPSISVSTNQSSIVGHILTSLTTKPSSPVMATSIEPFAGNIAKPIYFHAKRGAVTSLFPNPDELNSVHTYALSHIPKDSLKINEYDVKFPAIETPKHVGTQNSMLNYFLPEEHKGGLKGSQNFFADYALPMKLKHDWPSQKFSEISSGYVPLSLNAKTKLVLPVTPISWPIETKRDLFTMLPLKSAMTPNAATKNKLLFDINLPLDYTASIPNSLTTNTPNGISGSITGGISTGIPDGMTMDIPANIPTLNLGQTLHHVQQLRPTQEARNPWYPTGLLQLGGFDGINYPLHTGNSATRPMESGIVKAGLTSSILPQPHAPAFAKIGVGYHF